MRRPLPLAPAWAVAVVIACALGGTVAAGKVPGQPAPANPPRASQPAQDPSSQPARPGAPAPSQPARGSQDPHRPAAPPPTMNFQPIPRPPQPGGVDSPRQRAIREAQLLLRQEKYQEALAKLDTIPPDPSASDIEVILLRGVCYRHLGKLDDAAKLYRREADGMAARGEDPSPMLIELERVHREQRNPEEAFRTCLEIHRLGKGPAIWVIDEMESLIQADSLGERALPMLRAEIDRRPQAPDLRDLLVSAYLFLGKPDEALRAARDLDRSRGAHGRVLLEHLRLLDKKGLGQPACDAADAALAAGLGGDEAQEALYMRAGALRRMRRLPEASAAYDKAVSASPKGPLARVALRDRADLLVRDLGDLVEGAKAYEALIASIEKSPGVDRGRLLGISLVALADIKLRLGRYEEAASVLSRVESQATDSRSKEEAAFQQAEILFYGGMADSAEMVYGRVVKQYEGGLRINDALDRILMLTRCQGAGAVPIAALGQIEYQKRVGKPARALEICLEAEKACGWCAADEDLTRQESLLLLDLGRVAEAAVKADTLAARYPDGSAAPVVLRAVADTMRARDGDTEGVIRRYEDLLGRFPKSHEAFEVRPLLEKMRRTGANDNDGKGRGTERSG